METFKAWTMTSWADLGMVLFCTVVAYSAIILYTRLAGLRSFSQMSAFDFAMTIAIGSMFASTIVTRDPPLGQGLVGLAALYLGQVLIALGRQHGRFDRIVDNSPILLMEGPDMLRENMRKVRMTESDLRAKLREANVLNYEQVRAVVFETTGDVTVLHSANEEELFNEDLLRGVRR